MATRLVVTYCLCFPQSERTYYLPLSQTLVQSMTNPFFQIYWEMVENLRFCFELLSCYPCTEGVGEGKKNYKIQSTSKEKHWHLNRGLLISIYERK